MKDAEEKLYELGYYVNNQFDGFYGTIAAEYEISDRTGRTVISHLSEAQVIDLANMLNK